MADKNFKPKSSIDLDGSTSGTVTIAAPAAAGTTTITLPATTGTVITTGDTATVTNTMLSGSIANAKLANSSITIQGTASAAGGSTQSNLTNYGAVSLGSTINIPIRTIFIDTTTNFNSANNPYNAQNGDIVIVYTP